MTLRAKVLSWSRGGHLILDGVSLEPESGEMIGILGPNGSGKSSLLRAMAGLSRPDEGTVTLDDTDIAQLKRRELARRIAVVSQHATTDVDIAVADVVRLGRIPHASALGGDADADAAVQAALRSTGLTHLAARKWHTLSGGEQQRTQIARALAQQPAELILDEPTNHLDIGHQLELLALVADLPVTSYVALHDLNLAGSFCSRVLVLDGGRVVAFGAPAQVLTTELIATVYRVDAEIVLDESGRPTVVFRRPVRPSSAG